MASAIETLLLARMAATPAARAHAASNGQSIPSGATTQVTLGTVDFDNLGGFNASGIYTCPVAATYHVYAAAKWNNTASSWVHLILRHNGVNVAVGPDIQATTTSQYGSNVSDLIPCAAGDTIGLYASPNTTITLNATDGLGVNIYMIISLAAWS